MSLSCFQIERANPAKLNKYWTCCHFARAWWHGCTCACGWILSIRSESGLSDSSPETIYLYKRSLSWKQISSSPPRYPLLWKRKEAALFYLFFNRIEIFSSPPSSNSGPLKTRSYLETRNIQMREEKEKNEPSNVVKRAPARARVVPDWRIKAKRAFSCWCFLRYARVRGDLVVS